MIGTLCLCAAALMAPSSTAAGEPFTTLEPGLQFADLAAPQHSNHGDSRVRVLRIDPARFDLRLLNASAPGQGVLRSTKQWVEENGLVAAINASMFQADHRTSVSLMMTAGHVNNPNVTRDNAVLAFDPLDDGVPPVQIIDRQCQDFAALRERYTTFAQSIRMVSCNGRNVWSQQPREWSTAAIGMDKAGHVLFMHARSPYTTHDFINILLQLPINLKNAMYVEGGVQAQLYIHAATGGKQLFVGSYGRGFEGPADNQRAWPIPNVIGVARKP